MPDGGGGIPAKVRQRGAVLTQVLETKFTASSTVGASGDLVRFSVKLERKAGLDAKYPTSRKIDDPNFWVVPVRGGMKIDFSSGVFFTGLTDESYVTREVTDGGGNMRRIVQRGGEEDDFSATVGALAHVHRRGFPVAASFGVGTSGSRFNYYVGPSLLLGREQRWVLTAGLTGSNVKRLAGGLRVGDTFQPENDNIPTESRFRYGFFVGFSFNFTGGADKDK